MRPGAHTIPQSLPPHKPGYSSLSSPARNLPQSIENRHSPLSKSEAPRPSAAVRFYAKTQPTAELSSGGDAHNESQSGTSDAIGGDGGEEQRFGLTVRRAFGPFDLGLNLAANDAGVDTARLLTREWRF